MVEGQTEPMTHQRALIWAVLTGIVTLAIIVALQALLMDEFSVGVLVVMLVVVVVLSWVVYRQARGQSLT